MRTHAFRWVYIVRKLFNFSSAIELAVGAGAVFTDGFVAIGTFGEIRKD